MINIPESKLYYVGNLDKDLEKSKLVEGPGWLIGNFQKFKIDDAVKTSALELKYWIFDKKDKPHKTKVQVSATELNIILRGKVVGRVNGKEITLGEKDYILINPHVENNLEEIFIEDGTAVLTVKVPSDPSDKYEK